MAGAHKKVILRLNAGGTVSGYLPASGFVREGAVELLGLEGRMIPYPLVDIKMVSYVREFGGGDLGDERNTLRKTFPARPRGEGVWLRMSFRDGDVVECLAPPDVSFVDSVMEEGGLNVLPPDTRANTQRLFVPRVALAGVEFLAVILPAAKRAAVVKGREPQPGLFGE